MIKRKRKLVFGFGINDADYVVRPTIDGKEVWCPAYRAWHNMLQRCYSLTSLAEYPTYVGCSVCEEWRSFMAYKKWFDQNYVEGYHNDKDLRFFGNKVYSPETCIYAPHDVNSFFTDSGRARGAWPIGVTFNKKKKRFRAQICVDGECQHLGYFDCPNEAHQVWRTKKIELGNLLADKQTPIIKLLIKERLRLM